MKNVLILFLLFLWSFNSNQRIDNNVIDLLSPDRDIINNLSEIASDVKYIPLQTGPKSLIGNNFRLKVKGEFFYIATLDELFCFNNAGKLLFKVDKKGRGPEEYISINNFDINKSNTIIAIQSGFKIFLYKQTTNGFSFSRNISLCCFASNISFIDDNLLIEYALFDGRPEFSKQLFDLNGKVVCQWPNYYRHIPSDRTDSEFLYDNISYFIDNKLFLKELHNDTLFYLNYKYELCPFLIFNTKNRRFTPESRAKGSFWKNPSEYILVTEILHSGNYVYYSFSYDKSIRHNIYDLKSKEKYKVEDKIFLKDDLIGGVNFQPRYCNEGFFYSWVAPFQLKDFVSSDSWESQKVKMTAQKAEIKKLANSINNFDNPILILAKIK